MARPHTRPAGSARSLLIALGFAAVLVVAAGVLLGIVLTRGPHGASRTLLANAIGGPFQLVDQNGKPFTDADLKGKWHLVFFGYTHCPDTCPTTLNDISLALAKLGPQAKSVGVVFVSVDPERDTPAVLKSYLQSFDAPVVGLSGTPQEVAQAAKDYRVYYAKHPRADGGYDMDHSAVIYVMDPQGRFTATFTPDTPPDDMATRIQKLLG